MPGISFHNFENIAALNEAVTALLKHHFEREYPFPHAVMLSGGNTPLAAYSQIARAQCVASKSLRLLFSDERLVPLTSAASNFGNTRSMIEALHLRDDQVIRAQPELEPEQAAKHYETELRKFINSGGRFTLGLLGLGADGHTASLFSEKDLERARGRYVISSIAPDGVQRISVTPELLAKVRQIIFIVSGSAKKTVVDKLLNQPSQVIAGIAVANAQIKQLWFAV